MHTMIFTSGEAQQEDNGEWLYVLEWLNRSGIWIAYQSSPRYFDLKSDVAQLDRLGYYLNRRRVRHWFRSDA